MNNSAKKTKRLRKSRKNIPIWTHSQSERKLQITNETGLWTYFLENLDNSFEKHRLVRIPGWIDPVTSKYISELLSVPGELDRVLDEQKSGKPISFPKSSLQDIQALVKFVNGKIVNKTC